MNTKITVNNLELLNKRFEGKELKPAQQAAKGFIEDGIKVIKILNALTLKHEQTISNDFKYNANLAIESKQVKIKSSKLEQEIRELKQEIERLKEVNQNLMNEL